MLTFRSFFLANAAVALLVTSSAARHSDCEALAQVLPGKVFYPRSNVYQYENAEFWSNTELMSPDCVFRPVSAGDVSTGVKTLRSVNGKFAIRGGGHMGIKGANNIDDGVLLVLSNLTTLSLASDNKTVSIGPAFRWGDVYKYLQQYNLSVAGGRLSPVGVPGLLLGGGINFYGNQVGFSADTVTKYEVVTAKGDIIYATSTANSDLFWALKGGSSNFGIVTRFTMKTFPSKKVWAGIYSVGPDNLPQFLSAIANYSASITDAKSHIVPALIPTSPSFTVGGAILFYDSDTVSFPDCFKPFTDIPAIASTMAFKTIAEFADETAAVVVPHINDIFAAGTVIGKDYGQLLHGIQIINDTFFDALPELYSHVPAANLSIIELDWQPIGKLWLEASAANGVGGTPLGLSSTKGVYLCYAEVVEWIGSEYDDFVMQWVEKTTYKINNATLAAGLFDSFNYMGDTAGFQSMYRGYGVLNQAKLLSISRKYDPERLFQRLLPGGFKIGL